MIIQHDRNIHTVFDFNSAKSLGQGAFGEVWKMQKKDDRDSCYAVKTVYHTCDSYGTQAHNVEVANMKRLDHLNIIKLFETYQDEGVGQINLYLVLEYCAGGTLENLIEREVNHGGWTGLKAKLVLRPVLQAVAYMHGMGVCHRDLKVDNVLCTSTQPMPDTIVKVADLGLSVDFLEDMMDTCTGSPEYMAPEVMAEHVYDEKADVWSCGVIAYRILVGEAIFEDCVDREEVEQRLTSKGPFVLPAIAEERCAPQALAMLKYVFQKDPKARPAASEVLEQLWLGEKEDSGVDSSSLRSVYTGLHKLSGNRRFKRSALQLIARQLPETESLDLLKTFSAMDKGRKGFLSADDMARGLKLHMQSTVRKESLVSSTSLPESEVLSSADQLLELVGSGLGADAHISYNDFLMTALMARKAMQRRILWRAFCSFDTNGDGKLSKQEIHAALAMCESEASCPDVFNGEACKHFECMDNVELTFEDFVKELGIEATTAKTNWGKAKRVLTATKMVKRMSAAAVTP